MSIAAVLANQQPWHVECCDVLDGLAQIPDGVVHCVCCSPPYYGLRDYGTGAWEDGDGSACDHRKPSQAPQEHVGSDGKLGKNNTNWDHRDRCRRCGARRVDKQLGLEAALEEFLARLVGVFREVRRVLHPTGCVFVNMGDSYSSGGGQPGNDNKGNVATKAADKRGRELPPKNLLGVPWRLVLALQEYGWYWRSVFPWLKRSCMPESTTDRPSTSLEYVFLLTRQPRYFWDAEAVRQKSSLNTHSGYNSNGAKTLAGKKTKEVRPSNFDGYRPSSRAFRNSDLWFESVRPPHGLVGAGDELLGLDVTSEAMDWNFCACGQLYPPHDFNALQLHRWRDERGRKQKARICRCGRWDGWGSHFAAYPCALVSPLLRAGSSEHGVCPQCFSPWRRVVEKTLVEQTGHRRGQGKANNGVLGEYAATGITQNSGAAGSYSVRTLRWEPTCTCPAASPVPSLILDPFCGSGTSVLVANRLGRRALGLELSEPYARLAVARVQADDPLKKAGAIEAGALPLFPEG